MKDKFNYLYLDDNDKVMRDGDVELINKISDNIKITTDYPGSWSQRLKQISTNIDSIDGIILDWELTNKSEAAKEGSIETDDVDFSAESLAEHLRIKAAQGEIKDLPIILCSANRNKEFSNVKNKELTSQDLFDLTYIKGDLFVNQVQKAEGRLFDLAKSYEILRNKKQKISSILNIDEKDLKFLDLRFVDDLLISIKQRTNHDVINFLLTNFIDKEGPLISEGVMAARLGVDIEASGKDWIKLLSFFEESNFIYSGILSGGWRNFWSFKLDRWWRKVSKIELRTLAAPMRIEILNDQFQIKLIAAKKIKFCSSDEYWTVCVGSGKPLDPIDGFLVGDNIISPWLNSQFVSGFAEIEKLDSSWKINVMDREHYKDFKKMLGTK